MLENVNISFSKTPNKDFIQKSSPQDLNNLDVSINLEKADQTPMFLSNKDDDNYMMGTEQMNIIGEYVNVNPGVNTQMGDKSDMSLLLLPDASPGGSLDEHLEEKNPPKTEHTSSSKQTYENEY